MVAARFFPFVRASEAGWYGGIDRTRGVAIMCFLWIFFGGSRDFSNLLRTPRPRVLVETCGERAALAINPESAEGFFEFFFQECFFFNSVTV